MNLIGLLHGYQLAGSGSNLWTRYLAKASCGQGQDLHLFCQETRPEEIDFISQAYRYGVNGSVHTLVDRASLLPGHCFLHQTELEGVLPVYVDAKRTSKSKFLPMPLLSDEQIENYLKRNTDVLLQIVDRYNLRFLHANHLVLMSVVAQRIHRARGIPFAVMPHGSALEYVVKKDARYRKLAQEALEDASIIFFTGEELKRRLKETFAWNSQLEAKLRPISLGVDTELFQPTAQGLEKELKAKGHDDILEKIREVDFQKEKILLFVGALIPNKGLPYLLKAFSKICRKVPKVRLIIVGRGPLREELEREYSALEDRVLFLGFLDHSLLSHLYPYVDLAVFPSLIPEVGPLVFLEALSCACFPMGTGLGGMGQLIKRAAERLPIEVGELMKLSPEPDKLVNGLVTKIPKALARSGEFKDELRKTALEYDWNKVAGSWYRPLLELLANKPSRKKV